MCKMKVCCGGLNKNGPQRLMCLNAWPIGSGTIRKCCLAGVGVALLEKVSLWRQALRSQVLSLGLMWHSLPLPADQDVELLAPSPVPCLPTCHHASHHDDNDLNL